MQFVTGVLAAFLFLLHPSQLFANFRRWSISCCLDVTRRAAGSPDSNELWNEALVTEQSRSEVLLSQLDELGDAITGSAVENEFEAARKFFAEWESRPGSQEAFEQLRACNDQLQKSLKAVQAPGQKVVSSAPSLIPGGTDRLPGDAVKREIMPPVTKSDEPALVAGAPHVRVSLPLMFNGGLMWGCDISPLFDSTGDRLMVFTAFLPIGMSLRSVPRPPDVPQAPGDLVVVDFVSPGGEADELGIEEGDFLRAVSYMDDGPQPGLLDSFLGAKPEFMKQVKKCDGLSVQEVRDALNSNREAPEGMINLLLERHL